jgi:uncharacterized membrane-anchored protein
MRTAILLLATLLVLAVLNISIYQKQEILETGDTLLLKLAPRDPRSLLQGDYMRVRYALIDEMLQSNQLPPHQHGFAVIKPGEDRVAHFVRFYQGESLAEDEKLIKYQYHLQGWDKFVIRPDTFLFQEGLQPIYQQSAYAIFHYHGTKDYLLIGMADNNKVEIAPQPQP